ncbi:hypothetical protein [Amycolatopsis sp. MtRt-6]|uniref:hypothetical protein n=1 Tax=Amycolatopsis sp. MtRt-6 TaxID=2792782 RepID=UPI001A901EB2|nr:hypothetical protein [Amycolatopsis sp. MtRt-6]
MKRALAYEWARARSLRSTWLLVTAAGVLQFASGLYWGIQHDPGAFVAALGLAGKLGALLLAAVGIASFAADHQHGTLATTRLVLRSPARIVAARALVSGGVALLGGLSMVVLTAAGVVGGGPALPAVGGGHGGAAGAILLLAVLSGLAGVALGGLLRHSGLAVGLFGGWVFAGEVTLALLAHVPATVLPVAGTALLAAPGVAVFAGLVAVALAATTRTLT